MLKKVLNKYFVLIIIVGIMVGFFVSVYKFVFVKLKIDRIIYVNVVRILIVVIEGCDVVEFDEK